VIITSTPGANGKNWGKTPATLEYIKCHYFMPKIIIIYVDFPQNANIFVQI
jgi:hypothetical protein